VALAVVAELLVELEGHDHVVQPVFGHLRKDNHLGAMLKTFYIYLDICVPTRLTCRL
jgi:hypothetical protein